jgi:glycerol-3-phosphate dehydrogenase
VSENEIARIPLNQLERQKFIDQLTSTNWDLIVIGGGITGAGIAREAVARNLSVAILDYRDFAFGTSSRSTKLAHGGIRYLGRNEFGLVREATTERNWLRDFGLPHLTRPTRFLYPIYKDRKVGKHTYQKGNTTGKMKIAVFLYDTLSGFGSYKRGRVIRDLKAIKNLEPMLENDGLESAALWYDSNIDDARLVIETLKDAICKGNAVALNYFRVVGFKRSKSGRIKGVYAIDEASKQAKRQLVRGKIVVNATGVWADSIFSLEDTEGEKILRPTKGVHLVYHHHDFPVNETFGLHSIDDGRIFFVIRRNDWVIVGTTDTDYTGDPTECYCTREDADYLRKTTKILFPKAKLDDKYIQGAYAGLRPLIIEPGKAESEVSRKHIILKRHDGLFSLLGGKLTTFRRMAEDLLRKHIYKARKTLGLPKFSTKKNLSKTPFAITLTKQEWETSSEVTSSNLHPRILHHLFEQYGLGGIEILHQIKNEPNLATRLLDDSAYPVNVCPWILGEIDYVVNHEMPLHLEDVLYRRLEIAWLVRPEYQGKIALLVASRMGHLLGWSKEQIQEEIHNYLNTVRKNSFFFEGEISIPTDTKTN